MFHRVIQTIRHINRNHATGFEGYLAELQRDRLPGSVTTNEARLDYQRSLRSRERYLIG